VADARAIAETWLISELASQLVTVFETMTGERPTAENAAAVDEPSGEGIWWRQSFSGVSGDLWLFTAQGSAAAAARLVLQAAGMEDDDPATSKSTYLETASQAVSGLAQSMSGRLEREVTPQNGSEQATPPADLRWGLITLKFGATAVAIHVAPTVELFAQLDVPASIPAVPMAPPEKLEDGNEAAGFSKSKTFGLLLDVELPVSVSFGRAQLPLKEVLKLTTGSIIELNRSITEPVEVIVNNCVIARGEVVVVEGNFGIRIQHVISRQERLRTLH
jgi:flagellar motor switch protein FliN/FliY